MSGKSNRENIVAVIAGRMNSSRMYGKTMALLCRIPSLEHIIKRLQFCKLIDEIVVATTESVHDDPIRECAQKLNIQSFSGSEEDVLDRTVKAAKYAASDQVVIINGDSPIIDPEVVDYVINIYLNARPDYASNTWCESWPVGTEVEICHLSILDYINTNSDDPAHHEHVTLGIHQNRNKYKLIDIIAPEHQRWPELRLTLDTREDYQLISLIYDALYPGNPMFGIDEIINFVKKNPHIIKINQSIKQKEVK